MTFRLPTLCALGAALFAASTVSAQPPPKPAPAPASSASSSPSSSSDVALNDAKLRFEEGLKAADAGDNENARLKFSQAWVLLKSPAVLFNLARAEQLSGHILEALEHYRQFTHMAQDPKITDAQRQRASENVAELSKKVGQIDVEAPPTTHVSIDGRIIDSTTDPIAVTPGKHVVEATIDGKVKSVSVDCPAGTITKASLGDPNASSANANSGNGNTVPGPIENPPEVPNERTTAGWAIPITLGVLAVGGFVIGGVFASSSQSAKTDSETLRQNHPGLCATTNDLCNQYDTDRDSASSKATTAWIGYAAGGVFLIGAAATFVFWPKKKPGGPTTGMKLIPSVGPQGASATLNVTF